MESRSAVEASPIRRAVWGRRIDLRGFDSRPLALSNDVQAVADASLRVVRRHLDGETLYGSDGAVSDAALRDLAEAGYFGVAAAREYGGSGGTFAETAALIARMSELDPYVAGLMSTQACLGPIGVLQAFGTADQKRRLLAPLARGERLGAFAVTEPVTSSDWNMLETVARRVGDALMLTGEKFLITNAAPGRTVSVLCRVDGRFELVVVELPAQQDEHFEVILYGMKAPAHLLNAGLRFDGLRVPADNIIRSPGTDGRALAHFSLNRGRVAICAFASGLLRRMAAELVPWVRARKTFGAPVGTRDLVRYRLGRLAARIAACDALLAWTSQLLDEGQPGQLECITAKAFAGETVKEAFTDIVLKTQGGRAFLSGSFFTELAFDVLAPPIYEGETEILTLGLFRALARSHPQAMEYLTWAVGRRLHLPHRDASLATHAARALQDASVEISRALRRHGQDAFSRHADMLEIAQRVQLASEVLVVSRYGARQHDILVRRAAEAAAAELACRLTGARMTSGMRQQLVELGAAVAEGRFPLISPETVARAGAPRMIERLETIPLPTPPRLGSEEPRPTLH